MFYEDTISQLVNADRRQTHWAKKSQKDFLFQEDIHVPVKTVLSKYRKMLQL